MNDSNPSIAETAALPPAPSPVTQREPRDHPSAGPTIQLMRGIVVGSGILVASTLSGLPATQCYAMATAYLLGGLGMGVTFAAAAAAWAWFATSPELQGISWQNKRGVIASTVISVAFLWVVFAGNFNVWAATNHCNSGLADAHRTGVFLSVLRPFWLRSNPSAAVEWRVQWAWPD